VAEDMEQRTALTGPLLYSVEEAAQLLGIGRTFTFHLIATGHIGSVKIGKRRKIPRDAVEKYIEQLRSEPANDDQQQRSVSLD
jgi:excisionase family DNA binding protein